MAQYEPLRGRPIARLSIHRRLRAAPLRPTRFIPTRFVRVGRAAAIADLLLESGFHPPLLFVAPCFVILRLWFNMLERMVAIASGKASWRGEILNDLPDRVSYVLIFAGVAHSGG